MRIDTASRRIAASPKVAYAAFARADAMERWLPLSGMTGTMLDFDFRDGGSYRMRLTYRHPGPGSGKTSADPDEVEVRLIRAEAGRRIEQEVRFDSDDPAFAGLMRMTWTLEPDGGATLVTVRAENVPSGISAVDHEVGLNASLANLAAFVKTVGCEPRHVPVTCGAWPPTLERVHEVAPAIGGVRWY